VSTPAQPLVRALRLVILGTALMFAACTNTPTTPTAPATLTLQAGETMAWGNVDIKFVGVVNDSRCPLNALCIASIQAGDAVAAFVVTVDRRDSAVELALLDAARHTATIGDVVVDLTGLTPYPFAGRPTLVGDYRATIEVRRLAR
jgi:hypothetical protein